MNKAAPNQDTPRVRLHSLDSLRFLAATAVLFSHAQAMMPWPPVQWLAATGLTHPKSAVAFFFVLSGFVLHLSVRRNDLGWRSLTSFITRRWFRIYPLYYVSLLIALAVVSFLPLMDCPFFSSDASGSEVLLRNHADVSQWLQHALLIFPGLDMEFLNPPIWTLAAEMRIALVFPPLSMVIARMSLRNGALVVGGLFLLAPWLAKHTVPTAALIPLFALGAWTAEHGTNWTFSRVRMAAALGLIGVVIYALSPMIRGSGFVSQTLHMYVAGAGSVLVMLAVIHVGKVRALLEHRWLVIGGQVSYGVYALHFPILMSLAYVAWVKQWPAGLFHLVSFGVSVGLAIVLYRLVELPMIAAGRKVVRRWFGAGSSAMTPAREAG